MYFINNYPFVFDPPPPHSKSRIAVSGLLHAFKALLPLAPHNMVRAVNEVLIRLSLGYENSKAVYIITLYMYMYKSPISKLSFQWYPPPLLPQPQSVHSLARSPRRRGHQHICSFLTGGLRGQAGQEEIIRGKWSIILHRSLLSLTPPPHPTNNKKKNSIYDTLQERSWHYDNYKGRLGYLLVSWFGQISYSCLPPLSLRWICIRYSPLQHSSCIPSLPPPPLRLVPWRQYSSSKFPSVYS